MGSVKDNSFMHIFSDVGYPVFVISNYRFIYVNGAFLKLTGKKKLVGKKCSDIMPCNKECTSECNYNQVIKTGKPYQSLDILIDGKNKLKVNIDFLPVSNKEGQINEVLGIVRDFSKYIDLASEIIQNNRELRIVNKIESSLIQLDLNRLLSNVLKSIVGIISVEKGAIHLIEDGVLKLKAYQGIDEKSIKEVDECFLGVGHMDSNTKDVVHGKNSKTNKCSNVLEINKIASYLIIPLMIEDRLIGTIALYSKKVNFFSEYYINVLSTVADQIGTAIENASLYKKTKDLSKTDLLTGIANFTYFEEILHKEISRSNRNRLSFSILLIDIDNLSYVNDFYGHEAGDKILKQFAEILKTSLRKSDYIARYAGDEFIVLLPETTLDKAKLVANKICRKTSNIRLFGFDKKQLVSASIGLAVYPTSASSVSTLIKAADLAMYHAKQQGRDQTCVYDPGLIATISFENRNIKRLTFGADLSSIKTLVMAVDLKDNYTQQHSQEVSRLSVCLAQALGLSEHELDVLRVAGLLHDIGKIGVADSILLKPGPLTKEEYEEVKKHPNFSVNILKHSENFEEILPIILYHHERYDGKGYPKRLKGNQIPILARILSITDAYQAMVSSRPYRDSLSVDDAIKELNRCAGKQFDPKLVKVFTNVLSRIELFGKKTTA